MEIKDLVDRIVDIADSKKAENIVTVSMTKKSSIADYFVICEGGSDRQVDAIAHEIEDKLKAAGVLPIHIESKGNDGWSVLDYNQVIVHIFRPEERQKFRLEELWGKQRLATEGLVEPPEVVKRPTPRPETRRKKIRPPRKTISA